MTFVTTMDCCLVDNDEVNEVHICTNCYLLNKETKVSVKGSKKKIDIKPPHNIKAFNFNKVLRSRGKNSNIDYLPALPEPDKKKNLGIQLSQDDLNVLVSKTQFTMAQ